MFATRMSTLQQTNEELLEEVHFLRSENEKLKSEQDKI